MIIGHHFVWAHLGKTGGDALHKLLTEITPDLIEEADDPGDPAKHRPFETADAEILRTRLRVMTIRRLPAWVLSLAEHRARHGGRDGTPIPRAPADVLAGSTEPDEHLATFTSAGRWPVEWWLRTEHLREDLLGLVSTIRPVTHDEKHRMLYTVTKRPGSYDHDLSTTFTAEQVARLYAGNPAWAEVERRMYGGLLDGPQ